LNMIKKAMGLQHDKQYTDVSGLRYGRIMIMTDQDHDGSHIKGLFINFIHNFWPSLLKVPGFMCEFITPIVKATKGDLTHAFFTIPQYKDWCASTNTRGWTIKYYKGLGTSEPAEMQEYFGDLPKHKKDFRYVGPQDDEAIKLAFAKSNVDARKEWLAAYQPGTHLDDALTKIPYKEFIDKELILFSLEDCERSIASMMDGFKPGQRKIMFACFKRNLKGEIKIVQLAGYVLEHCAYHHGDVSLYSTMIGMAHNFVGSNNLNLLEPVGNFGSRIGGGKDAAAARYIFTTLSPLTRYIFHPDDDEVLDYLEDEGMRIQPKHYAPVVPMVLINGNAGIGTGWSSMVPNYNPRDVVANLRRLLNNEELVAMQPWYRGFQGTIEYNPTKRNYLIRGAWRRLDDDSIEITELPIGTWTQNYKESLETMILANEDADKKAKAAERADAKKKTKKNEEDDDDEEDFGKKKKKKDDDGPSPVVFKGITIKDFKEYHTTTRVHFVVFSPDFATMSDAAIEKAMKLTSSVATSNMHLFDADGCIKKYPTPEDVLKDFFITRLKTYQKRKDFIVDQIGKDLKVLDNKMRFIKEVIEKTLVVANRKKQDLFNELRKKGYDPIPKDAMKRKVTNEAVELLPQGMERHEGDEDEDLEEAVAEKEDAGSRDYDYLLSMAIWSLTAERYKKLLEQVAEKQKELAMMKAVHPADLWERDLDAFMDAWNRYETNMTILDEAGVGGCAFRKPTISAKSNAAGDSKANRASNAKREQNREAFKRLQKLGPVKTSQPPPTPHKGRNEIVLPEVQHDPIIPPVKVKKEDESETKPKRAAKASGKASILNYMKPEPVVKKELTEAEILALPLSERLALRARTNVPSSSPIKSMTLDDFVGSDSEDDYDTISSKKSKKPRMSTALIDLSESDGKPALKKPKLAASKRTAAKSRDDSDDEIAMFDDDAPRPKRASASRATERMVIDDDSDSDVLDLSDSEVAPKKPKATRAKNSASRAKADSDDDFGMIDSDSDDEVLEVKPVKKLAAKPATAKVASAAKAPAKATSAPKRTKATTAKRTKSIDSDSDLELSVEDSDAGSSDDDMPKTSQDRPKRTRATPKFSKFADSDSDDIQLEDSDF